jgi:hypothetical protein
MAEPSSGTSTASVTMLVTDLRTGRVLHCHDFSVDRTPARALTTTLPAVGYADGTDGADRYEVEVRYEVAP